ncbi:hypothetical protein [Sorangium sp. So ce861]|uniref:hypothetical protein n=1 Tax=Sorangium sp. So ce861 TaxID=3133323 RepID=UPI003F62D443
MRRLANTSISLFFGLTMLQTFGAGCTARVELGDDSGDGGGQETGPDDDAHGSGSGGAGGGVTAESGSSVGNGGNSGTGGGSDSTGSGSESAAAGAIALYRNQFHEPSDESGSSSSGGGPGPGTSPNDLFILFGAPVSTCADPSGTIGCGNWQLGISITPALQVPGIIDLSAPEVLFSYYVVSRPDNGYCWSGEGSFRSGTMEIVSIDAAEVVVRLSGTDTHEFDANGEYIAARCP